LDKLIRQYQSTGLPTEDAWIIIKGMCAALSYAHAEKIIHSDFKPGNVFVTKKGLAKVFDFGIARAVAKVEQAEDSQDDKTVFDAANLGALTPAYASLEMLEGKEPDIRDDIYALGCVAYELFTAEHPYKKIPADEAAKQGLKPKRISNISKAQWRAIEQAIAFKREDRIATVDKFVEAISPKSKTTSIWVTAFAFLLSAAITVYFVYFQEKTIEPGFSEFDIRNELELKIRVDYLKENLERLISSPAFTRRWAEETWKDVSDLTTLTKGEDPWVDEKKNQIYQLHIDKINDQISAFKYTSAQELIDRAKPYTPDVTELDSLLATVLAALKTQQSRKAVIAEKDRIRKINLAKKQKQDQLKQQQLRKTGEQAQQKKPQATKTFNLALENVNAQLKCIERLNMRNIETAVVKLREVDIKRYNGLENNIVNSLAACIVKTGKLFPQRAIEAKKQGLRLFKSNAVLSAITIKARDACDLTLAGLGARGKRAICKDKIKP
ncbi:MAG: protein kinase, partial [Gammaproteobacteria bacterium]|nr:protein kinase [Gammaproteobacteria bacterium]